MNKQQLANRIWEAANRMRSNINANQYKDYILGFIFYKYLSDKELEFLNKNEYEEDEINSLEVDEDDFIKSEIGYFIPYKHLFSTWLSKGVAFQVGDVSEALGDFERNISSSHKKVYEGIFDTLRSGLSKLGESTGAQTKAVRSLIELIKDIPMDGRQDYDVLGFIYEYLIGMFAANAGKKAGEFYTPHEVAVLMSEIVAHHLQNREKIEIFDPTSGSGSLLITIGKSVSKYLANKDGIKYFAQELMTDTYNLTRMNLVMRGINPSNIKTRCADTLAEDWPYFDENQVYSPLYLDAVVSNPPYSQKWDPTDKEGDPRYSCYGLAPKSKADYAFLLHDLYHIKPDGIMTIVLPHGVLFRGGEEERIRKNLIEANKIDTIIGLPANIFYGTGIPTIIMILKQERDTNDVLIIDASKGFEKNGTNNKLRASDIKRIVDAYIERKDTDKFSKVVSKEEIRQNEYNLNIPRYVDSSDKAESWDIYSSIMGGIPNSEIDEYEKYWKEFPNLKQELFSNINSQYSKLNIDDASNVIKESADVVKFMKTIETELSHLPSFLQDRLLDDMMTINPVREENNISTEIFACFDRFYLIDKYAAYQILDDNWKTIASDLEMLQTEGFDSVRKVDPRMIMKKDSEVQEGWIGHIIPFDLIEERYLKNESDMIKMKENRLQEISSEYSALLDKVSEEDKNNNCDKDANPLFSEDCTTFVNANVKKAAKKIQKGSYDEDSLEDIIVQAAVLIGEEAALKKTVSEEKNNILQKCRMLVESLSDSEAKLLLTDKWINPLVEQLKDLSMQVINDFIKDIKKLSEKYAETLLDIDNQISSAEKELADMIDELCGSEFDMAGLKSFQAILRGKNE